MRISLILAHPDPHSLNHALAGRVREILAGSGHEIAWHDLYAEGFDPVLRAGEARRGAVLPPLVRQHCDELAQAEGLVFVHPNWWGMPPAMFKGWVDRVVRAGVAYEFLPDDPGEGVPRKLLKARAALVINTSDTPPEREQAVFGDPLGLIWKNCILPYCGVPKVARSCFSVVVTSSPEQRQAWLREAGRLALETFAE